MANAQYTISNTARGDTNEFTVPGDEDGGVGDDSFQVESDNLDSNKHWYVHIDNGWDQNVDVTIQGSHFKDESMSSAAADGTSVTVNAGEVDFIDGDSGHSHLEVAVTPATAPTSGDLVITFQSRED